MSSMGVDPAPSADEVISRPADEASIWRNGAFVRLFTAASISYVGSFVTRTALPLAAIYGLSAGPMELSAIRSFEFLGWLLVGLVAGAWVDRLRRRPVMIVADLGRAVILISIPIAAIGNSLTLAHLVVAAFLAAILSVFFNAASGAYLPSIVARSRLVAANSAMSASASIAEFTGFGLSGVLVQVLTAPIAIAHAADHLLWGVFGATYLLFAVDEIGLPPAAIGVITAIGGLGSLAGAAMASRVISRLGAGRAMIAGLAGAAVGSALIPLAPTGAVLIGGAILIAQQIIADASGTVYEVVESSVTQTIVHDRVLGRVKATVSVITTVTALAGTLLGGIVGVTFGLRAAFLVGIAGAVLAAIAIWASPAGRLRRIEDAEPIAA